MRVVVFALLLAGAGAAVESATRRGAVLSTYAGAPLAADGSIDCGALRAALVASGANSYNFLLEDKDGRSYLSTVRCLATTLRNFTGPGGAPFRAWLTLIPPTEATSGAACSVPADSPFTPFNETALFNASKGLHGCQDYRAWAEVTGRLAALYPALRYLNVDDLTHNPSIFTATLVARMAALVAVGGARLIPVVYYGAHAAAAALPIDGMLFYFRNEKEGGCPAACGVQCADQWPTRACLAGACAETTVANLAGEVADVRAALPAHLPLHVGVYVTGRPARPADPYNCSTPSAGYGRLALQAALRLPAVSGATAYRMQVDANPQRAAIAAAFVPFDARCPTRTPYAYGGTGAGGDGDLGDLGDGPTFCCASTEGFPSHCSDGGECCLAPGRQQGGCGGRAACQACPASRPHVYGDPSAGWFCCAQPAVRGDCPGSGECCSVPGEDEGCQGRAAC